MFCRSSLYSVHIAENSNVAYFGAKIMFLAKKSFHRFGIRTHSVLIFLFSSSQDSTSLHPMYCKVYKITLKLMVRCVLYNPDTCRGLMMHFILLFLIEYTVQSYIYSYSIGFTTLPIHLKIVFNPPS